MYPKGTSSKDKEAWKASKGISRKKHKTQDTTKRKQHAKSREQFVKETTLKIEVNKLKDSGLSIRKIARELKISVNTVQKYIIK